MKYINIALYILAAYAVLVLLAETLIWRIQPSMDGGVTLIISADGEPPMQRNLYGFEHNNTLYVSSNHWFRSWYTAALKYPNIQVTRNGITQDYTALAVDAEHNKRLLKDYNMGFVLRLICGFAPSKFLQLEPR